MIEWNSMGGTGVRHSSISRQERCGQGHLVWVTRSVHLILQGIFRSLDPL